MNDPNLSTQSISVVQDESRLDRLEAMMERMMQVMQGSVKTEQLQESFPDGRNLVSKR